MARNFYRNQKLRFGGLSVVLTVALIALVILLNVLFSSLANKFRWYVDMTRGGLYSLSESCAEQLEQVLPRLAPNAKADKAVRILFLDTPSNLEENSTQRYVYSTAQELAKRFPDYIEVSWVDIWTNPSQVQKYKEQLGLLQSTMVVLDCGESGYRVLRLREFFSFAAADSENPLGYNGDEKFATAMVSLLSNENRNVYLTTNHGETYYDTQILYNLVDAGYFISYLDLLREDIPDACDLLILYNPTADLTVADGVSDLDERVKLDAFFARGGDMMVFLSDSTQQLPNLDAFLADWGVQVQRHTNSEGQTYSYMIKDPSASLTSDGSTIVGQFGTGPRASSWFEGMTGRAYTPQVIFKNATSLCDPSGSRENVWTARGGQVEVEALFTASSGSEAWSSGAMVDRNGPFCLMTVSEDRTTGSHLVVHTSAASGSETYFISATFGNAEMMQRLYAGLGKQDVLFGIPYKPFADTTIHSITTAQMARWTVALSVIPGVLVLGAAVWILVRRKNA
ncbi:MAG: Gldg family protein [Clostridia bacterium]|nr:Gldg family protein [Clostridia bacterium]